jgi:hypothetical protein
MDNIKNIESEITDLTQQWYRLISSDHHKDRDCHWYIETIWSYGELPKYIIRHSGYILDNIKKEVDTYEKALIGLRDILIEEIKNEKNSRIELEDM